MKSYAFYHRTDQDGKCCAAIFNKFLIEDDVEIIGWNYSDGYDFSNLINSSLEASLSP